MPRVLFRKSIADPFVFADDFPGADSLFPPFCVGGAVLLHSFLPCGRDIYKIKKPAAGLPLGKRTLPTLITNRNNVCNAGILSRNTRPCDLPIPKGSRTNINQ